MASIRKFFEKRKLDVKFKTAGKGHKLTEEAKKPATFTHPSSVKGEPSRNAPSDSKAAAAALARFEKQQQSAPSMANRSMNVIRAEAMKELAEERKNEMMKSTGAKPKEVSQDSAQVLAVNGVYFSCALIGPDILPYQEMKIKIKEFLYQQLEEERGLTACLIIHTCNKKDKVQACVETITKCFDNIVNEPTEEKYRRLRMGTKTFQDKIRSVEGAEEFLFAAGFESKRLPYNDGEDEFLVYPEHLLGELDRLQMLRDSLMSAEPIAPQLDRNARVISAKQQTQSINLPSEFYYVTADDIKKEQILKQEEVDKLTMLRTKAMRERDEIRELRKYRFTLLRIRFPDDILLQGTFYVREKLSDVMSFVQEHLAFPELPFVLCTPTGRQLNPDDSEELMQLQLVPAAVIHFSWDPSICEEVCSNFQGRPVQYLKEESMMLCH